MATSKSAPRLTTLAGFSMSSHDVSKLRSRYEALLRRTDVSKHDLIVKLRKLIMTEGIPDDPYVSSKTQARIHTPGLRARVWLILLGIETVDWQMYVDCIQKGKSHKDTLIQRDVPRTFPTDRVFRRTVSDVILSRILNAFVHWCTQVFQMNGKWKTDSSRRHPTSLLQSSPRKQRSVRHLRRNTDSEITGISATFLESEFMTSFLSSAPSVVDPVYIEYAPILSSGYIQGINRLAAPFALVMPEVGAFHGLIALLTKKIPRFFEGGLVGVMDGCTLVDRILTVVDPELQAHLSSQNPDYTRQMYAFARILSLYACCEPSSQVVQVWDALMAFGPHLVLLMCAAEAILIREDLLARSRNSIALLNYQECRLRAPALINAAMEVLPHIPSDLYEQLIAFTVTRIHVGHFDNEEDDSSVSQEDVFESGPVDGPKSHETSKSVIRSVGEQNAEIKYPLSHVQLSLDEEEEEEDWDAEFDTTDMNKTTNSTSNSTQTSAVLPNSIQSRTIPSNSVPSQSTIRLITKDSCPIPLNQPTKTGATGTLHKLSANNLPVNETDSEEDWDAEFDTMDETNDTSRSDTEKFGKHKQDTKQQDQHVSNTFPTNATIADTSRTIGTQQHILTAGAGSTAAAATTGTTGTTGTAAGPGIQEINVDTVLSPDLMTPYTSLLSKQKMATNQQKKVDAKNGLLSKKNAHITSNSTQKIPTIHRSIGARSSFSTMKNPSQQRVSSVQGRRTNRHTKSDTRNASASKTTTRRRRPASSRVRRHKSGQSLGLHDIERLHALVAANTSFGSQQSRSDTSHPMDTRLRRIQSKPLSAATLKRRARLAQEELEGGSSTTPAGTTTASATITAHDNDVGTSSTRHTTSRSYTNSPVSSSRPNHTVSNRRSASSEIRWSSVDTSRSLTDSSRLNHHSNVLQHGSMSNVSAIGATHSHSKNSSLGNYRSEHTSMPKSIVSKKLSSDPSFHRLMERAIRNASTQQDDIHRSLSSSSKLLKTKPINGSATWNSVQTQQQHRSMNSSMPRDPPQPPRSAPRLGYASNPSKTHMKMDHSTEKRAVQHTQLLSPETLSMSPSQYPSQQTKGNNTSMSSSSRHQTGTDDASMCSSSWQQATNDTSMSSSGQQKTGHTTSNDNDSTSSSAQEIAKRRQALQRVMHDAQRRLEARLRTKMYSRQRNVGYVDCSDTSDMDNETSQSTDFHTNETDTERLNNSNHSEDMHTSRTSDHKIFSPITSSK